MLFSSLLKSTVAFNGPIYLDIDVTERCNLKCLGCMYHSDRVTRLLPQNGAPRDLPFNLIKDLCDQLDSSKTSTIILQGAGEPLLHPKIFEIIDMFSRKGFETVLITNATLLSEKVLVRLVESGLDTLTVSLWATNREQYAVNHPGTPPEYFDKIIRALDFLKIKTARSTSGPKLKINYVVNKTNMHTLEEIVRMALEWDCHSLVFTPMTDYSNEINDAVLTHEKLTTVAQKLVKLEKKYRKAKIFKVLKPSLLRYKYTDELWNHFPCLIAWFHMRMRVDGVFQPCGRCKSGISFGNLHHRSFNEIWNGAEIRDFRHKMMQRAGMEFLADQCSCRNCCFVHDIKRLYDVIKWFRPSLAAAGEKAE